MSLKIKDVFPKLIENKICIIGGLSVLLLTGYVGVLQPGIGYAVTANGAFVGYANNPFEVKAITYALKQDVKKENGKDATYILDLDLTAGRINSNELTSSEEIKYNILNNIDIMVPALVIKSGNEPVIAVDNMNTAEKVLEKIQEPFKAIADDVKVEFAEMVEVVEFKQVYKDEILTESLALAIADKSDTQIVTRSYNRKTTDSTTAIPTKPLIDVKTTYTFEGYEIIPTPVEKIKDPYLKKGEIRVESKGSEGSRDVKKIVTSVNNKIVNEKILTEKIIVEPKAKIVYEGTGEKASTGLGVVSYAKNFIGVKYKWGGTTPKGFDCSGFTSYVYREFGISLPRTSSSQAHVGKSVSYSQAVPGDLIVFSGHVGIYVGDGNMIHSPRVGQSVTISPISTFGKSVKSVRRLI